jgi:hypothetical protein
MSIKITMNQRKRIFALLPTALKEDCEQRQMMVARYTKDSNRKSLNDLYFDEANKVIENYGGIAFNYDNWAFFDSLISQHRKIMSVCHDLHWTIYSTEKQQYIVDLKSLSEFLKSKKCPVNKPLKVMDTKELSKVIYALEQIFTNKF